MEGNEKRGYMIPSGGGVPERRGGLHMEFQLLIALKEHRRLYIFPEIATQNRRGGLFSAP